MKQCPCGHVFDDTHRDVRCRWSNLRVAATHLAECTEGDRYVQCPKCKAWTLDDLLTLAPKESTDG